MTRSSIADLEGELRTLFVAQSKAIDEIRLTTGALERASVPVVSDLRPKRTVNAARRRVVVAGASVAATVTLIVAIAVIGRSADEADLRTGDPTTSAATAPEPTDPPRFPSTEAPAPPTVDRIDSIEEFRSRVEHAIGSPGAQALLGAHAPLENVTIHGDPTESRLGTDGARSYGIGLVAATGARGGISAGDHLLPLGQPETMLSGEVIEPVALPSGIEEGVLRDNGQSVAVALRGGDQFVTLVIEKLDTGVTPSMLIPIAAAVLVPPLPAPTTGPGVSDLGRFDATVLPDGFFETGVAETADPTSTSVTAHFLTGTDQQALVTGRRLNVTTVRNADAAAVMADIGGQPGIRTLDVRGYPALIQVPFSPSLEPTTALSLVWSESPTMVVFVNGRGLTEVELVAVANGLRPR